MSVAQSDPRTGSTPLGVSKDDIFQVLGGGQADFESPLGGLSPDDLALLYAYWNQLGHVKELVEAFDQHLSGCNIEKPIVIDLGCGPFTGGLAIASALEPPNGFTYIGMDRASAMRRLGERLAVATIKRRGIEINRIWSPSLAEVEWSEPPHWRPVIVIVSYLLASPTIDPMLLAAELDAILKRIGRGPLTLLYTNSVYDDRNVHFPAFRRALELMGLTMIKYENGQIETDRSPRRLRYALFSRKAQDTLELV
ncbi:MAG TPA: hypothetical protein VFE62_20045 [Gemmataceae bacterium]|nr:hypothetical protein [Gemmataceae bacterium]